MVILGFDIETNGLLQTLTKVHSLVITNVVTRERTSYADQPGYRPIAEGVRRLMEADLIVGHNIIKFDLPALQKVYPWFQYDEEKVFDTIVASRLIWTNLVDTDMAKIRAGRTSLTPKLAGWHSLEAWGHRLGNWKGDFSEVREAQIVAELGLDPRKDAARISELVWAEWSVEMQDYCEQDVDVTLDFYELIVSKNYSIQALDLEHQVCFVIAEMERNGYRFDTVAAEGLLAQLSGKRAEMEDSLRSIFKPWYVADGGPRVPKKPNKKMGYCGVEGEPYYEDRVAGFDDEGNPIVKRRKVTPFEGYPYTKIKLQVFNPNSRDQISDRLTKLHGWKPREFTPSGKPKVDETVLGELPYPEAKELTRFMTVQKRIGQLAEGDNAWLAKVDPDGRIRCNITTNGAVTGRATHSSPNLAQVPACDAEFGPECRTLFTATPGKTKQLGCDVSGLELRMLGHFMAKHDGGAYANEVINGDVHTVNQHAAGLSTRGQAKTFIYAFLYGAGDGKIGSIIGKGRMAGRAIKAKFFKKVPALKKLIDGVKKAANSKGHLKGLDGRLLHIRSDHAALNTLLQSAGALVCKQWIVEFVRLLRDHGLYHKVRLVIWVHDELQMEIETDLDESYDTVNDKGETVRVHKSIVGDLCIEAIRIAGEKLGIRVPLTGEFKIGNNWKDCH
ncbi:hypothetical protein J1C56_02400 [Aminobacter anthyllidis]|uniref:DNA polymerase I n=1 Tax=Aminobacter anthyllidis TaxID=1035067 RepID=A0A9X1A6V5_9HYPH|nr:DNA polymerase [Aminobacter anthyllidis]MBT1154435.1 hypothetical protein [Aminobacter anthyllidis]